MSFKNCWGYPANFLVAAKQTGSVLGLFLFLHQHMDLERHGSCEL